MELNNKQRIKCEVDCCKNHDCGCNECILSEINIIKNKLTHKEIDKQDTICNCFEKSSQRKDKK
ncbi:MAG: hypothetical protein RSE91_00470 [Bacilli bacterium]